MSIDEALSSYFTLALSVVLSMAGCEEVANSDISSSYANDDLSFSIPSNWQVTNDGQAEVLRYVIVQGPGGAVLAIQSYPTEQALSLQEYVRISTKIFVEDIPIGEITDSEFIPIVTEIEGETYAGIENQFSISLFKEKTPHVARYYSLSADERTVFFKYQVLSEYDEQLRGASDMALSTLQPAPSTD